LNKERKRSKGMSNLRKNYAVKGNENKSKKKKKYEFFIKFFKNKVKKVK
jgi:hypothetical protein